MPRVRRQAHLGILLEDTHKEAQQGVHRVLRDLQQRVLSEGYPEDPHERAHGRQALHLRDLSQVFRESGLPEESHEDSQPAREQEEVQMRDMRVRDVLQLLLQGTSLDSYRGEPGCLRGLWKIDQEAVHENSYQDTHRGETGGVRILRESVQLEEVSDQA